MHNRLEETAAVLPALAGYHPLLTLLEAVPLSGAEQGIARKSYIFAAGYQPTPFPRFAGKARAAGLDYHEVESDHFVMQNRPESDHFVMQNRPEETVAVLRGLAE